MTRSYVVPDPPELISQISEIVARIQPLWDARDFRATEPLFRQYYETMRACEETLPEGKRLHKGAPLHNWGISILLQEEPTRIQEAVEKIFLAYIEDLLDFDTIDQVHSSSAYKTLYTSPIGVDALSSAQTIVEELRNAGRIPKNPEEVFTESLRRETQLGLRQTNTKKLKTVFVVHGRNLKARDSMYSFLRSLDMNPINLAETMLQSGLVTPYIGEVLDYAFSLAQAVVVLMTPDDVGCLREPFRKAGDPIHDTKFTPQARLNVIFEAGMAMEGKFRKRTILVELGQLRQLTDLGGLFMVRLDNSIEKRQDLIARLKNCGCTVNDTGDGWRRAGDFETTIVHKENFLRRFMLSHL
ncbi:nucleotide-binding protein [Candidatus Bathyarchaeota archaeon]|nr:nucleotide-binding protein [Candidatus Bathyarchaeota archaeon]